MKLLFPDNKTEKKCEPWTPHFDATTYNFVSDKKMDFNIEFNKKWDCDIFKIRNFILFMNVQNFSVVNSCFGTMLLQAFYTVFENKFCDKMTFFPSLNWSGFECKNYKIDHLIFLIKNDVIYWIVGHFMKKNFRSMRKCKKWS